MRTKAIRLALLFSALLIVACGGSSNNPRVLPPDPSPPLATNLALRFFGTGANNVDRVLIALAAPSNAGNVSLPVNIGAGDFTIEFWLKGNLADNVTPSCFGQQAKDAWRLGNIVLDRDVAGDGDRGEYGVSLRNGTIAFGAAKGAFGTTLCGGRNVLDGNWHHVAVTREVTSGTLAIFVDGALDMSMANVAASGDISYRVERSGAATDPFLVVGAEKTDSPALAAFNGLLDELRLSTRLRYTGTFTRPGGPFSVDGNTAALYHFNEGSGATVVIDAVGPSPGLLSVGGPSNGPAYVTDVPF
ncbi:MAG TPA: LamG domain-containing protein [Burkholderiaceae bacterium]|nr:LamG domain-containing protein [Burkholderiaceae bacterium]